MFSMIGGKGDLLKILTPRLGFEPRYPEGNEGSSLAQYQIMRLRHKIKRILFNLKG